MFECGLQNVLNTICDLNARVSRMLLAFRVSLLNVLSFHCSSLFARTNVASGKLFMDDVWQVVWQVVCFLGDAQEWLSNILVSGWPQKRMSMQSDLLASLLHGLFL